MIVAVCLTATCCVSLVAVAQGADDRSAAEAAIRQAGKEYLAAIQKGDAKAIAAFWTADGTYTDESGATYPARELIETSFVAKQEAHPPTEITAGNIRLLTPDVGIEEGTCKIHVGKHEDVACGFMAVWVRKEGKWKLASLRESRATGADAPTDHLAVLEPFVGEWTGQADNVSMRVSAKWNANKTFLRREITATAEGKEIFHGQQIVGWDPLSKEFRTWAFNEDGGYAEGLMSLEGNVWMSATTGIKPTGEKISITQIFKFPSKDKMLWKLKTAMGEQQPTTDFQTELTRSAK